MITKNQMRGMTLIEIMVVVAIMAVFSGLAVQNISVAVKAARMRGNAEAIGKSVKEAMTSSDAKGGEYVITIIPSLNKIKKHRLPDGLMDEPNMTLIERANCIAGNVDATFLCGSNTTLTKSYYIPAHEETAMNAGSKIVVGGSDIGNDAVIMMVKSGSNDRSRGQKALQVSQSDGGVSLSPLAIFLSVAPGISGMEIQQDGVTDSCKINDFSKMNCAP